MCRTAGRRCPETAEGRARRAARARERRAEKKAALAKAVTTDVDLSYQSGHMAPTAGESNSPIYDMSNNFGNDYLTHPEYYSGFGRNQQIMSEVKHALQQAHGNPNATITIYRALPIEHDTINHGDWVTISKSYAQDHLDANAKGEWHIISKDVPAHTLWTEANDITEWGYDETCVPPSDGPTQEQHIEPTTQTTEVEATDTTEETPTTYEEQVWKMAKKCLDGPIERSEAYQSDPTEEIIETWNYIHYTRNERDMITGMTKYGDIYTETIKLATDGTFDLEDKKLVAQQLTELYYQTQANN